MIELPLLPEGKNVCVALSGGLDSTTLVHLLVKTYGAERVKAISFDYGQRHTVELDMAVKSANRLNIDLKIIHLDYLGEVVRSVCALISDSELSPKSAEENSGNPQVNTYVPYRNAQFAFITAAYAESNDCRYIFQGLNITDEYSYWDVSSTFIEKINDVLNLNRMNPLEFVAPFVQLYKEDELRIAKSLSNDFGFDILEYTWSCYNGDDGSGLECGQCNTCSEKLKGYVFAGFTNEQIMKKFNINEQALNEYRKEIE